MSTTAQCDGKHGVCPDEVIGGRNDVIFISGVRNGGVTSITYMRPLQTNEAVNDRAIPRRGDIGIIAALGPLNSKREANAHGTEDNTADDEKIDFSRTYEDGCPISLYDLLDENATKAFQAMKIEGNLISLLLPPAFYLRYFFKGIFVFSTRKSDRPGVRRVIRRLPVNHLGEFRGISTVFSYQRLRWFEDKLTRSSSKVVTIRRTRRGIIRYTLPTRQKAVTVRRRPRSKSKNGYTPASLTIITDILFRPRPEGTASIATLPSI